jgi:hypothetical protein
MNPEEAEINRKVIGDRRKEVNELRYYYSTKITELVRIVGVALAGLYIFFSISTSTFAVQVMAHFKLHVAGLSAIGCIVILLEYLQYWCAMKVVRIAINRADDPSIGGLYPRTKWMFLLDIFFQAKQVAAFLGTLGFIVLLGLTLRM